MSVYGFPVWVLSFQGLIVCSLRSDCLWFSDLTVKSIKVNETICFYPEIFTYGFVKWSVSNTLSDFDSPKCYFGFLKYDSEKKCLLQLTITILTDLKKKVLPSTLNLPFWILKSRHWIRNQLLRKCLCSNFYQKHFNEKKISGR